MPGAPAGPAAVGSAELVRGAASGDAAAWDRLMDRYGRLIWAITWDFNLAESDASSVVQTTWLRLIEHIDRIEYPERVGAWLATTARNECLRSIAARRRLVLVGEESGLEAIAGHERLLVSTRASLYLLKCDFC